MKSCLMTIHFDFDDDTFGEITKYIPEKTFSKSFTEMLKEDKEKSINEMKKYSQRLKNIEEQKMINYYNDQTSLWLECSDDEIIKFWSWLSTQEYNENNEKYLMCKEDKK